jgi:hypothetical protein
MMKFFSPILKEFVVMMHRKEIAHNNNKILNWNISNTTVITDPIAPSLSLVWYTWPPITPFTGGFLMQITALKKSEIPIFL